MVTFSFHGDDGAYYGMQHVEHYAQHAQGGAGMIIVQATNVSGAATSTNQWSADNRRFLTQIAKSCHRQGVTAMIQLACGNLDINILSISEIQLIQKDMKQACICAGEMGFDGAEFHFAHGFTLCKMLDAAENRRTDQFGGKIENRTRILTEILPEIRAQVPPNFLVGVRMGEYQPNCSDGTAAALAFEQAGIDLLHISFGMHEPGQAAPEDFICSRMAYSGHRIRRSVHIPVIAVGELRTEEQVRYLVEKDYADFAGIGRGMLADPQFANHVMNSKPINACHGCRRCLWFTDHFKCPARRASSAAANLTR
jgi:2,4-dienoyl-CoA reductase-like NADH-dependent reductase (Old Yellow Enzyme family)